MNNKEHWLDAKGTCEYLGISHAALSNWKKQNKIQWKEVSKRNYLYNVAEFKKLDLNNINDDVILDLLLCKQYNGKGNNKLNVMKAKWCYLKKNYNNIFKYLKNRYTDIEETDTVKEIVYRIINKIEVAPRCLVCNKKLIVSSLDVGYQKKFCSKHCMLHSDRGKQIVKEIREKTNLEKYGTKNPLECKEVKEKIKKTNLEKYGVENYNQLESQKEKRKNLQTIWTYKKVYELAKICTSYNEFINKSRSAYSVANKNNWLKNFTWLKNSKDLKYSYGEIKEIALKYKNAYDFLHSNDAKYYRYAKSKNWICTFDWFTNLNGKEIWDYARCYETAQKYNTIQEFRYYDNQAYKTAYENKWLNEYNWLEDTITLIDDNNSIIYAYEFSEYNSVYIGLTTNLKRRHYNHMNSEKSTVYKFIHENNIQENISPKIVFENLSIRESQIKEAETLQKYKNEGWNILNIAKPGVTGISTAYYMQLNKQIVLKKALRYSSLNSFKKYEKNAYKFAKENNFINELKFYEKCKWKNEQQVLDAYKNLNSIKEFNENHKLLYAVRKFHCLDKIHEIIFKNNPWEKENYMNSHKNQESKWSKEKLISIAKECTSLMDFNNKTGCRSAASKLNCYDEIRKIILDKNNNFNYHEPKWNRENILELIKKYSSYTEFCKKMPGAYKAVRDRLNMVNDIKQFYKNKK